VFLPTGTLTLYTSSLCWIYTTRCGVTSRCNDEGHHYPSEYSNDSEDRAGGPPLTATSVSLPPHNPSIYGTRRLPAVSFLARHRQRKG
jgi:hypothetical protein